MVNEFEPMCLVKKSLLMKKEGFAHTATGYLIPCCHIDYEHKPPDPLYSALLNEELKLSNNESIEDILLTDEWLAFSDAVVKGANEGLEYAPLACRKICGPDRPIEQIGRTDGTVKEKVKKSEKIAN
jgi:hypothetical protein|tara:strand:- start:304 stop:684 length:381 start_codon:yes stop_codon:yes gene_type:complete